MNITTLFNLGDKVYSIVDSGKGNLIPLIIEKIKIDVESTLLSIVSYQVSTTAKFHNTVYFENELENYESAKIRAENKLNEQIAEIQQDILEL